MVESVQPYRCQARLRKMKDDIFGIAEIEDLALQAAQRCSVWSCDVHKMLEALGLHVSHWITLLFHDENHSTERRVMVGG
jgi:hypothetical protein